MYVRSTNLGMTNMMSGYIQQTQSRYYDTMAEGSSGKKVTEASDDPIAAKNILNINTKLDQLSMYLSNMKTAQSELSTTDSSLASLVNQIQDATDLATQASNGTYSDADMKVFKTQIDQIINNVVDTANTTYNGNYVFSGTSTSTQTYSVVKDADGNITGVKYNGTPSTSDYERKVTISDGVSVGINVSGDSIFGSYSAAVTDDPSTTGVDETQAEQATGLLGSLVQLSNALGAKDQSAARATLSSLNTALDTVSASRTKLASVSSRFDITTTSINSTVLNLKDYRSDLQDADLAEVAVNLQAQETALNATMSITSSLLSGKTLLDYL